MPSDSTAKAILRWLNVGLRGIMEAGIVVAFAIWGYHAASGGWPLHSLSSCLQWASASGERWISIKRERSVRPSVLLRN